MSGLANTAAIAAGWTHSLAVRSTDGTVWAWGKNTSGQLGNGSTTNSSTPVQVSGLSGVVAVAAGRSHSLALKSDGTVWAWGYNGYGQLGNNSTLNSTTPVQVSGLTGASAISAGADHSMALGPEGKVWSWGYNFYGQLGNGQMTDSRLPVETAGLSGVKTVAAGQYHSLAASPAGAVSAWGNNEFGQLGNASTTDSHGAAPVGASAGTSSKATYAYDGNGLRTSETAQAAPANVSATPKQFSWDVSAELPLLIKEATTSYIYGPGGMPLEQIDSAGNATFFHQDQLGSTRALTDNSGAVVATYTYDAYGKTASKTGTATTPLQYAGQYTDPETGFQYLRARYYDPETAQFLTKDPIAGITQQPYSYADNSSLNLVDPTGLFGFSDAIGRGMKSLRQFVCAPDCPGEPQWPAL